jgi:hypothetical protein
MWYVLGMLISFSLGAFATWRSRTAPAYYDSAYGMTPGIHQRYALAGWALTIGFAILSLVHWEEGAIALFGVTSVVAVVYGSSFLRGAVHEDE